MRSGRFVKKGLSNSSFSSIHKNGRGRIAIGNSPSCLSFFGKLNDNRRSNLRSRHRNCHDRDRNHNRNYGGGEVPLPWHHVRA